MCGIAGILHFDPVHEVSADALGRMAAVLAHRGPDAAGVWTAGPVGFAHRRLAIIDLARAHQPTVSAETGVALTYNGEIYNYLDLRDELAARGVVFRERSDTEVLLRAFEMWGAGCVDRLNGMFAFAAWDPRRRELTLVRDRLGIKPLYFRRTAASFVFASELKALAALNDEPMALDAEALQEYLRRQYVPGPLTIVHGVLQLQPGRILTVDADGRQQQRRYWRPQVRRSAAVTPAACRERVMRSVRSHMVADVPVGAFLSGGIDSSFIVAAMAATRSTPVDTFSVGFEGGGDFDEREAARSVAHHFGTRHHERLITAKDALDRLPHLVARMDEPFADFAALPTFLVAELAAQHVKVVLTGEGADELFGGYRRYRRATLLRRLGGWAPRYQASHLFSRREIGRLLGESVPETANGGHTPVQDAKADDPLNHVLADDIEGWLADDLLVKVDRMTMLCSLEARVPYLDHELVDFALSIPGEQKLRPLRAGDKRILRAAAEPMLPPAVARRPKHGFTAPVDSWMRAGLVGMARELLTSAGAAVDSRIDRGEVVKLLDAQDRGGRNGHRLWALLVFELWSRRYAIV